MNTSKNITTSDVITNLKTGQVRWKLSAIIDLTQILRITMPLNWKFIISIIILDTFFTNIQWGQK